MADVYVSDVGMTRFGKREESLTTLMHQALMNATEGAPPEGIDAVFVGCQNPDEFTGDGNIATQVTDRLGIRSAPSMRIDNAPASGSAVFHAAYFSVASGRYGRVLVLAGEKMSGLSTPEAIRILSKMLDGYERDYGATITALAALVARRYMHDYGLSHEDLSRVAVKNHANGTRNPFAQFQKEVSLEKAMESRVISDPLRLYDCSSICDGAAAAILTSESTDVQVTGTGHATDYVPVHLRDSLTSLHATKVAGERAYALAGRKPSDIDVAEIHDAFSILEIINSEDLGFFPPGEGGKALAEGRTAIGGDLPINPSGGLKARGHPVGATGLAQICEIVWQLRGEAGERQVKDPKVGLCHNIGGFGCNNVVTILEGRA